MVKAGRWLRNFFFPVKKEKNQEKKPAADRRIQPQLPPPPPPTPPSTPKEEETRRHKPLPAAAVRKPASRKTGFSVLETVAAVRIQAWFRSFLARKALRALKGLVKLQAAVRGFLVRKQAAAALRSMQALATAQGRARALRVRMSRESPAMPATWREAGGGRAAAESNLRRSNSTSRCFQPKERNLEKLTEMEHSQSKFISLRGRKTNPNTPVETGRKSFSYHKPCSTPSRPTDSNTAARNAHAEELSVALARSGSQNASTSTNPHRIAVGESGMWRLSHDSSMFPNYMLNTESWKAKARSHSVPRQRSGSPDSRQSGGQRPSFDGKNLAEAAWVWSRNSTAARDEIPWDVVHDETVTNMCY